MKVIGLTGGIASGKSLVTALFRKLGASVISADEISRQVEQPGTEVFRDLVEAFGTTVLRPDGTLDRKRLGELIFRDATARARLNAITHPRIRQQIQAEIKRFRAATHQLVIVDIPLLLDTAPRDAFDLDGVIVVVVDPETQIARLMAREGLTREAALRRLQAQRPLAEKAAEADWIIDNSTAVERTRRQVEALWQRLRSGSEGTR